MKLTDQHLFRLLLVIGLLLTFFLPPTDPDLGWQLRCGQQIWQQGQLCHRNQFSLLLANYPWAHSDSLYQALIYPFYQLFNLWGLSFLNGLLIAASFLIFISLSGQKELKIISLPLIILLCWSVFSFGLRGQLLSFFYFLVLLKLIELAHSGQIKQFWLAIPLMWLWANSHGGFVLGLLLLAVFFLTKLKQPQVTLIVFLSFVATLFNPFGFQIHQEAWRHFQGLPLAKLIAEWVPPNFPFRILIFLLLILSLAANCLTKKQDLRFFKFLSLLGLAFLAFKARRNLPFFFIFTAYSLASSARKQANTIAGPLAILVILAIFSLGFFFQLPKTLLINSNWIRFCQAGQVNYPYDAVEFLRAQSKAKPSTNNIFNRYEWGGFLIWQLPEYKVFVDGRMPAWFISPADKSPYTIYLETLQTQPGWQKTLNKYHLNWILISPGTFMDLKLQPKPTRFGWQEVYRNENSVIYKRNSPNKTQKGG